jgi:hypothetical protein
LKNSRCPCVNCVAILEGSSAICRTTIRSKQHSTTPRRRYTQDSLWCKCNAYGMQPKGSTWRECAPTCMRQAMALCHDGCYSSRPYPHRAAPSLTVFTNPTYSCLSCGCFSVRIRKPSDCISVFCAAIIS